MGGVIHFSRGGATLDPRRAGLGVYSDPLHQGQIDHQPVVADAEAGAVVAATADGEREPVLPAEVHCTDNVANVRAARDQPRVAVDHPVIDLAGVLIAINTG